MHTSSQQKGFSLIELIAVLMLIGLMVALVGGGIARSIGSAKIRSASKDVVAALKQTRGLAIIRRQEQVLEFNVEARTFTVPGTKTKTLPDEVGIKLVTAESELLDNATGGIRFFADGSSTGGSVSLISGERQWLINVAWLTGEVTLDDGST